MKPPRYGLPELLPSRRREAVALRRGIRSAICLRLWLLAFLLPLQGIAAEAIQSPRRGGTLRVWRKDDWRSLDPAIAFDADSTPLQKLLFRGLLNYGAGTEVVPDQAAIWDVSPDGRTYTMRLRPGVRFSNGRTVEAADYVFSFERTLNPATGSPGQLYLLEIAGADEFSRGKAPHVSGLRTPDANTLVIELSRPSFTFRYVLAMNFAAALPRDVVEHDPKNFQYHLIGSGPYRLARWQRGVGWRFERNPHYTGSDGHVDAVEIALGGDSSLASMMLERGELDWFVGDPVSAHRFSSDPARRDWVHWVQTVSTEYLFFNTEVKPFDDVRVRRAFNHAIDKERMIRVIGGRPTRADGIVPPSMPWTNPGRPTYEFNPDKARALLREAGIPTGTRIQLWFIESRPIDRRVVQSLEQDLSAVGIALELKGVSYPAFEVRVRTRRTVALGLWGWVQDYPDPSTFLDTLLNGDLITGTDCNNVAFYNQPEVNRRVREAGQIVDAAKRLELFREAESQAMADAPWVPLYHPNYAVIRHPRVRGDAPHPVWLWRFENMWLAE